MFRFFLILFSFLTLLFNYKVTKNDLFTSFSDNFQKLQNDFNRKSIINYSGFLKNEFKSSQLISKEKINKYHLDLISTNQEFYYLLSQKIKPNSKLENLIVLQKNNPYKARAPPPQNFI